MNKEVALEVLRTRLKAALVDFKQTGAEVDMVYVTIASEYKEKEGYAEPVRFESRFCLYAEELFALVAE